MLKVLFLSAFSCFFNYVWRSCHDISQKAGTQDRVKIFESRGVAKTEKTRFNLQALGLALEGIFSTRGQVGRSQSSATSMTMCMAFLFYVSLNGCYQEKQLSPTHHAIAAIPFTCLAPVQENMSLQWDEEVICLGWKPIIFLCCTF